MIAGIFAFLPKLVVAVIILMIAAWIARMVRSLIEGALGNLSYGRAVAMAAYVFILGLGVITALSQVGIAVAVTLPILYFILLTIAGILIVGVGGALIGPMRGRVERFLDRTTSEIGTVKEEVKNGNGSVVVPVTPAPTGYSSTEDISGTPVVRSRPEEFPGDRL